MPAKKAASDPEEEKIMRKKAVSFIIAAVVAAGALTGCGSKDDGTIKVAATEVPHAEILEAAIFRLRYSATMYSQMRWWKQGILTAIISSIPLIWTALTRKRAHTL